MSSFVIGASMIERLLEKIVYVLWWGLTSREGCWAGRRSA